MEMMVMIIVLVVLLAALMTQGQGAQNQSSSRADDIYEEYLAWKYAREAARGNTAENGGCLGLLMF